MYRLLTKISTLSNEYIYKISQVLTYSRRGCRLFSRHQLYFCLLIPVEGSFYANKSAYSMHFKVIMLTKQANENTLSTAISTFCVYKLCTHAATPSPEWITGNTFFFCFLIYKWYLLSSFRIQDCLYISLVTSFLPLKTPLYLSLYLGYHSSLMFLFSFTQLKSMNALDLSFMHPPVMASSLNKSLLTGPFRHWKNK